MISNALMSGPVTAKVGQEVTCYVSGTFVIVAFGFKTHKERADFDRAALVALAFTGWRLYRSGPRHRALPILAMLSICAGAWSSPPSRV